MQDVFATPETVTVVQVVQPVGQAMQLLPANLYPEAHLLQDGVEESMFVKRQAMQLAIAGHALQSLINHGW